MNELNANEEIKNTIRGMIARHGASRVFNVLMNLGASYTYSSLIQPVKAEGESLYQTLANAEETVRQSALYQEVIFALSGGPCVLQLAFRDTRCRLSLSTMTERSVVVLTEEVIDAAEIDKKVKNIKEQFMVVEETWLKWEGSEGTTAVGRYKPTTRGCVLGRQ